MDILSALEHHRAGRLAEAVEIYQQILQANPNHADALHLMGNAACQLGDFKFAITLISKACDEIPNNTSYLISLGMAYRMNGQFDLAGICYSKVLELDPNSASAYFGIGNTEQCQGKPDDAARNFIKAIELNPEFIEARYNLANIQKSLGQFLESIDNYRIVVTSKPDFSDAFHNMGSALYALGKQDEALSSYKQALSSNLPETHNNIGIILFDRREFDQAQVCYQKAISIKPDYAIAYLNLGDLLMETDRLNEAAIQYELAIAAAPKMAEAYFNLGIARNKLNDFPAAHSCFEHALACRPDYCDALYNLGVVNAHLLNHAEAERCYREVLKLDPYHVNSNINLAAILTENGYITKAKQLIVTAYSQMNIFENHSFSANKTVLILFDVGKGNLNLSHLVNQKTNNIIDWMIEYASDDQVCQLPHYDVVFNAMGDPDTTGDTLEPVNRFLQVCSKPLLNHPDKVARTARNKLPALIEDIDNLLIPPVWRFANFDEWVESIDDQLPLLIRPVHTQGGIGLVLAKTPSDLEQAKKLQSGPVYVSRFIDFRSADSWYHKYRIIFIDRKPYPYHLAISQNWMVHYYTSEMETYPWKLEEEKVFLQDPEKVLGFEGWQAITAIGERLDLDYAGIDFTIMADGRILVFEANPTMLVHPESISGPLAYKNGYVNKILNAFEELLMRSVNQISNL